MNYKDAFSHFLIYNRIPWILSWQYSIHFENFIPILVQKIFIRWWDKFNSPINLDFLLVWSIPTLLDPQEITLVLFEPMSLSVQKDIVPMKSTIVSTACPPILFMSPVLYL